jgi:hypothetical protein
MGTFVRVTLVVAVALVAIVAFVFVLKLLVIAAVIAAVVIFGALLLRILSGGRWGRLDRFRDRWVTTLTARR